MTGGPYLANDSYSYRASKDPVNCLGVGCSNSQSADVEDSVYTECRTMCFGSGEKENCRDGRAMDRQLGRWRMVSARSKVEKKKINCPVPWLSISRGAAEPRQAKEAPPTGTSIGRW